MSEIKVGDTVRVVQIIVKENDCEGTYIRRVKFLKGKGMVVSIYPWRSRPYRVILTGSTIGDMFDGKELKVLSVPCEQRTFWHDGNRTRKQLYARVEELRRRLDASIKAEEDLSERLAGKIVFIERLQDCHKQLRGEYDSVVRASAAMRVKIRSILDRGLDIPNNAD